MNPLLVFAMEQESRDVFGAYDVLYSGIGKVNASYALTKRIVDARPELVVNLGTAGSQKHSMGTVINPTRFVQRDMDVSALGFEKYQTPFSDDPVEIEYGRGIDGLAQGVCGSGDSFATEGADAFDCMDMEAYALALICAREDIPFLCLKYISDGADDGAAQDWNEVLDKAAAALHSAFKGTKL